MLGLFIDKVIPTNNSQQISNFIIGLLGFQSSGNKLLFQLVHHIIGIICPESVDKFDH